MEAKLILLQNPILVTNDKLQIGDEAYYHDGDNHGIVIMKNDDDINSVECIGGCKVIDIQYTQNVINYNGFEMALGIIDTDKLAQDWIDEFDLEVKKLDDIDDLSYNTIETTFFKIGFNKGFYKHQSLQHEKLIKVYENVIRELNTIINLTAKDSSSDILSHARNILDLIDDLKKPRTIDVEIELHKDTVKILNIL